MTYSKLQELLGPPGGDARLTLASTTPTTGSGTGSASGNLKHTDGPWTSAAGTAAELRTSAETSRAALGPGHDGVAAGGAGLTSVAALAAVRTSWEDRLAAVREECGTLESALRAVAKEMGETDAGVRNSLAAVHAKPEDKK